MSRLLDVIVALVGLAVTLPFMLLIALLVKLDSGGPVLFRQSRVGRGGKDFMMWKFRTMTVQPGPPKGRFEPGNCQRVTKVGRFLRATKLDELPQLFQVLSGAMSVVGPRPPLRRWVDAYPERWARILSVRPGITHPAAIAYRHEEEIMVSAVDPETTYREELLPHKLELYERYLATRTFWSDIKVILQTVRAVLWGSDRRSGTLKSPNTCDHATDSGTS